MKRRGLGILLAVAAAACASGCAVQGRQFEKAVARPDQAVIYVYRPYHYGSSLLAPPVTCGEETARIGPGGYHAFVVPAGKVTCAVQTETADEVNVEGATGAYYIREEFNWGALMGHPHLNPVDSDGAQTEIQTCCVQEPDSTGRSSTR
ncbi:MAG TPA: hypothetical protein VEC38_10025 [Candidatus Binataceae bacterium]|nr:hypothetical protein [Candidatus Binataceae bacterium]